MKPRRGNQRAHQPRSTGTRRGLESPGPEEDTPAVNEVKRALLDRLQEGDLPEAELAAMALPAYEQDIALRVLEKRRFIDIVPGTDGRPVVTLSRYARQAMEFIGDYWARRAGLE
ncbi:MAG: hypothetical protein JO227_14010 [Acetobacteraceae bacterium]|nr:hypothetical protein [Acetobacteraceae bacterium]